MASAYCPDCGQKDMDLARPMTDLMRELLKETLEVDGRAFRTVRTLFLQPGTLTTEFLAGRRRAYTPPLRLYIFISVAFFIVAAWLARQGVLLDTGQSMVTDAPGQAQFLSDELPRIMFVLLPIFALLLKLTFLFSGRYYSEHLVFAIHNHCFLYIATMLIQLLELMTASGYLATVAEWMVIILSTWIPIYLVMSLKIFYAQGLPTTIMKSLFLSASYFMLLSFAMTLTVIWGFFTL